MLCHHSPHWSLLSLKAAGLWPERTRNRHSARFEQWTAIEPSLSQMLDDPIIQDVMRSDAVARGDIENLFTLLRAATSPVIS